MKSRLLIYFLPMIAITFLLYGYTISDNRNAATSLSENTPNWVRLPDQIPNYTDLIGAWSSGAPVSPSARYYSGGVGYTRNDTGWIYIWGGDSAGSGAVTRFATRYNINTNSWSPIALLPGPIRICGSARLLNNIYSIGGSDNTAGTGVATVYKYDINTNTWATMAPIPAALYFIKAVGYQDSLIYTAGGYNGASVTNAVYLYNSTTNTWRNCTPLPDGGAAEGAFSKSGDTLVYAGGLNSGVTVSANVYRGVISQTDRSVITWTTGAPYPLGPKYRFNAYEWGNKGVIIPGGAVSGFTGTNTNYIYSPGANTWTVQANKPNVACAYQGGSVSLANGIWKCVIAGGVGAGALSAANDIFTDTLSSGPPPPTGNTLVLVHDTLATSTTQRKADRDTLNRYLAGFVGNYTMMGFDTNTVLPDLTNYNTIILQETSFDAAALRYLGAGARTQVKNWLASGTGTSKKSLISIGADQGYNYSRNLSPAQDLVFAETYGKFIYRVDNAPGTVSPSVTGVTIDVGNLRALTSAPPGGSYWPDGCSMVPGGSSALYKYQNRTAADTLGAIGNIQPGYVVATIFQDPRYFTGGFGAVLGATIGWVVANGGVILGTNSPTALTMPDDYNLSQNYPNPFNPTTKIDFSIPKSEFVSIKIYDILGKEIMTLVNQNMNAGNHQVSFDGSNFSSGTYFYRIETGDFVATKKMSLLK